MSTLLRFPFDGGQREDIARSVLPDGLLRQVEGMYLRRDGQLAIMEGDAALDLDTSAGDGDLVADQLVTFRERLCAIGRDTSGNVQRLFTYVPTEEPVAWSLSSDSEYGTEIPPTRGVTWNNYALCGPGDCTSHAVAANEGYVVSVSVYSSSPAVTIARAWDPQGVLLFEQRMADLSNPAVPANQMSGRVRVFFMEGHFVIVGLDLLDTERMLWADWVPTQNTGFGAPDLLFDQGAAITGFDACVVEGQDQFVVAVTTAGPTITAYVYGSSGVLAATITGPATAVSQGRITCKARRDGGTWNHVGLTWITSGNAQQLSTWNATTGAADEAVATIVTGVDSTSWPALGIMRSPGDYFVAAVVKAGSASTTETRFSLRNPSNFATDPITFDHEDSFGVCRTMVVLPSAAGLVNRILFPWRTQSGSDENILGIDTISPGFTTAATDRWLQILALDGSEDLVNVLACNDIAVDAVTGRVYLGLTQRIQTGGPVFPSLLSFAYSETAQRQCAETARGLYISGGLTSRFDGAVVFEAAFNARPKIPQALTPSNGAGSLTPSSVYQYVPVWALVDANGDIHRSFPGGITSVTLGASDDTVDGFVTTPHTNFGQKVASSLPFARSVWVELYRTEADGSIFRLAQTIIVPPLTTAYSTGVPVAFIDTVSDATLATAPLLYTEEFPENGKAPPTDYLWPGLDALLAAGLAKRDQWTRSQRLVLGEPVQWAPAGDLQFSGRVPAGAITAAAVKGNDILLFQRDRVDLVSGDGPDVSAQGEFFPSRPLLLTAGVEDWRALIDTDEGLFFKANNDRIYLLRGGEVEWVSFPITDTLVAFPNCVGATFIRNLNQIVFALENGIGGGKLVFYDLRRKLWTTKTPVSVGVGLTAPNSIAQYNGVLVYSMADDGSVYASSPLATRPNPIVMTGSFGGFDSLGYGALLRVGLLFEFRSSCTLNAEVSYDDGNTFVSMGSFVLTGSQGQVMDRFFTPARQRNDRFVFRFTITGHGTGEGVRLNTFLLETEKSPGTKRASQAESR